MTHTSKHRDIVQGNGADGGDLFDAEVLAAFLKIPLGTLYQMNHKGTGPRRIRVGKYVRYRRSDVDAWLESRVVEGGGA